MAHVAREYDDRKIAEAVKNLPEDELLGHTVTAEVEFSPPVANGFPTGTIRVTTSYTLERDDVEAILEQSR